MKQITKPMIALLFLALIGCGGGAKAPGVTDTEILLGSIPDLSGPAKEVGTLILKGAEMSISHANSSGGVHGRQIKLAIEDAQYNPQKTVVAAKKLIEKDQVFFLFGVFGTSHTEALRSMLVENKIPLIAPATQSGTMSDMSRPGAKYIFHTELGYNKQVEILVAYALKQNPNATIGIIYQDDDYGENAIKGVEAAEKSHDISIQKEAFQRGTTDFTGQVRNVLKGGCDVVLLAGIVKEPIIIMKTAAAMGYKPQFLGLGPTMDHRVPLAAGEAGEGFISINVSYMWNSDHPTAVEYREMCNANNVPEKIRGMYHLTGFKMGQILIEGLERAGKNPTRESLINGMESIRDWDGTVAPPLTYGPNDREGADSGMLIQIINGVQTPITGWLQ